MKKFQHIPAAIMGERFEQEKQNYIWVDVRTKEEYDAAHIEGSIHIPYDEMEERYQELLEYQTENIMLVCRSGMRSQIAANTLSEHGFKKLYNLEGGLLEWTGRLHQKGDR